MFHAVGIAMPDKEKLPQTPLYLSPVGNFTLAIIFQPNLFHMATLKEKCNNTHVNSFIFFSARVSNK